MHVESYRLHEVSAMEITSPAFDHDAEIPMKYTCDGDDASPPLVIDGLPNGTAAVTLICDDPDAGKPNFTHWVLFNLPPTARTLREHLPATPQLPDGTCQGVNDFGTVGYGGPCPPRGAHHYRFTAFALDAPLKVPASSSRSEVEAAMKGHVLGHAQLTATYQRHRQ
jgi:Raf kinase inhibitor-like YbhB/YbcL family protein